MIENRRAHLHHGPSGHRVIHRADVRAGDFVYPYEAHHAAHETVDHERILADLDAKLAHRAAILPDIFALIHEAAKAGTIPYRIVEANVQVHGPADFHLFVAWEEEHEGQKLKRDLRQRYEHPQEIPTKQAIRGLVAARVSETSGQLEGARQRIRDFAAVTPAGSVPRSGKP